MSPKTMECVEAIKEYVESGKTFAPIFLSYAFGRATCSAAIRFAKKNHIIKVAYMSAAGTPVYEAYDNQGVDV